MINRRRILQTFLSFAAAGVACRHGNGFNGSPFPGGSAEHNPAEALEELLRAAIDLWHHQDVATESRRLCEIALRRVHRSPEEAPRFWQACTDSVSRLESLFSGDENPIPPGVGRTTNALYQLRSLRQQLADRTIQAVGGQSQLCRC